MKEWSNLPNAKHIDCVLQAIKDNPDEWAAAWDAAKDATSDATRDAAWNAAYDAVWDAALDAAWGAARGAAWNAVFEEVWVTSRGAAWNAVFEEVWVTSRGAEDYEARYVARYAVLALVAYDDIEHYFLSSYEELRFIAELTQHPAAILLLPAIKARELIEAKNERVD